MTLHCLSQPPEVWLGEALERFERRFDYPLGPEARFCISHGTNYLTFFAAMGRAQVYVAERAGVVLGTLAHIEREAVLGDLQERRLMHYLCDLKVAPEARGGRVLARLMAEARRRIAASSSHACYAVVMSGTGKLPTDYTGRLDVPEFPCAAEIMILRISSRVGAAVFNGGELGGNLSGVRFSKGHAEQRSLMRPELLEVAGASGVLEDTRRGKRLWSSQGAELMNAHVSQLRFDSAASCAALLDRALVKALQAGFEAIFAAMPLRIWKEMRKGLEGFQIQEAPAAVYGYDLPAGLDWWIDTAEI